MVLLFLYHIQILRKQLWRLHLALNQVPFFVLSYQKEVIRMSDTVRTVEEYIQRHARQYCNGDVEAAKEHAIVKALVEEKQE